MFCFALGPKQQGCPWTETVNQKTKNKTKNKQTKNLPSFKWLLSDICHNNKADLKCEM
jgi:hypothetical protein